MKKRIVLVGCSKQKGAVSAPAALLYKSPLFRKSIGYAKYLQFSNQAAHVLILSAKYGAVRPDQHIEPYDLDIGELNELERHCWEMNVRGQLQALVAAEGTTESIELVWLTGKRYQVSGFHPHWTHHYPLEGMGIGIRKRWLAQNTLAVPIIKEEEDGQLGWLWKPKKEAA